MARTVKGSKGPGHDFAVARSGAGSGYTFGTGRFVKRWTARRRRQLERRETRREVRAD